MEFDDDDEIDERGEEDEDEDGHEDDDDDGDEEVGGRLSLGVKTA